MLNTGLLALCAHVAVIALQCMHLQNTAAEEDDLTPLQNAYCAYV